MKDGEREAESMFMLFSVSYLARNNILNIFYIPTIRFKAIDPLCKPYAALWIFYFL